MEKLVIYGAGGFGREVALMIKQINDKQPTWDVLGFYDDGKERGEAVDDLRILGGLREINAITNELNVVVAIADPSIRKKIVQQIVSKQVSYPVIIHPSVLRGDEGRNRLGRGCIISAGCIFTTSIHLSDFVIVNLACTLGHDVTVGKFSSVMPGCNISGFVRIEEQVYIGTGAKVLPNLSIGVRAIIGAGAVVTKNVETLTTVVGVPADILS